MHLQALMAPTIPALAVGLSACAPTCGDGEQCGASDPAPEYLGVETRLLDGDLVNFRVSMQDALSTNDIDKYAECAAAQYALIRGFGFARHVRTTMEQDGRVWRGDAVYTISASLPRGLKTIDAEVTVSDCEDNQIPTV
nr:hypothetical protein [uncultured Shimia sp.]